MQGIELLEGDVWGHRKDIDEYFTIDESIVNEIHTLAVDESDLEHVANQMRKKTKIGSDLVKYIAKNRVTA